MNEHAMRPPVAAGRFYPADAALLLHQIEQCYTHPLGPTSGKDGALDRPPLALIVPHGALGHAGPVTAHAFAYLEYGWRQTGVFPEWVVLLGPDHQGLGASVSATRQDYTTPLGGLSTQLPLVDLVCESAAGENAGNWLAVAETGHRLEHALENVIPFLQHQAAMFSGLLAQGSHAWNLALPGLLPLTIRAQDFETAERLGVLLDRVLPREGVLLIATSDLCHCGLLYGNAPVLGETPEAFCHSSVQRVAEALGAFDPKSLVEAHHREAWCLCGIAALAAALQWAHLRGGSEVRPLCLADSVAVAQAWNNHPSLPREDSGVLLYPWSLLTEVDTDNPVGFGSFAVL